jgi:flagellar hook-associated protein 1 FlgK
LLDERDRLIGRLSDLVQVSTVAAEDGSLGVFIGGGQRLVLGGQASSLTVVADPADPARSAIAINEAGLTRTIDEDSLGGGSIAGWLQFQNNDLVLARSQLGQMAAALAGVVNAQQALGLDLSDPPGSGAAIFAVGGPQALAAQSNQRDFAGNFVANVTLTVTDATQLLASEYELRADAAAPGTWRLTRLADGLVRSVTDGALVDGFRIDLGTPAPAPTDRFLLQPVTRSANGMRRVLDSPQGLAAAAPVTATSSPANTGTANVASLTVVSAAIDPDLSASVTFTSASGGYAWELRDRTTNALVSSGTATWSAGAPIALNGFELALNGVPRTGDVFSIVKTAFPGPNNSNALAMVALRDRAFVGRSVQSTGALGGGNTVTDAYAAAMAAVGVRVQGATTAADVSASVASQAEQVRSSSAGVNLDEEAARLLQFQQSYQAASKVLQIAQSVFDTLLDAART